MLRNLGQRLRRYARDESGSAGAEFVVSVPLLIGVMVIASEYGGALQMRDALDAATGDASRFLARAPLNADGTIRQHFIDEAQQLIADRLGISVGIDDDIDTLVSFEASIEVATGTSGSFRTEYRVVTVDSAVQYKMPLLALLDVYSGVDSTIPAINMFASDTARYVGEVPPSETSSCNWVMVLNSEC